jgi:hypothetical protein
MKDALPNGGASVKEGRWIQIRNENYENEVHREK